MRKIISLLCTFSILAGIFVFFTTTAAAEKEIFIWEDPILINDFADAFNVTSESPKYRIELDLNKDNVINMIDVRIYAQWFTK